ncbi:MAG: SRPBCC family protein [Bacteroidales bacterium]|jgi:carbon monoxide dehydrogenase subunit G
MSKLEVISKTGKIPYQSERVYTFLSDFRNFDRLVPPDAGGWSSTEDTCRFKIKGQEIGMEIMDREPNKTIKIRGAEDSSFPFLFWIQLKEVAAYDTRTRLTLHADVNMMLKLALKKQLQKALDQLVDQMAIIPYP